MLKDAIEAIRGKAWKQFERSKTGPDGQADREEAHMRIRLLQDLLADLDKHLRTGKLAADALNKEQERREKDRDSRPVPLNA